MNGVLLVAVLAAAVVGIAVGAAIIYLVTRNRQPAAPVIDEAALRAQIQANVEASLKERLLEAKEEAVRIRTEAEKEARETKSEAIQLEKRLLQKEENLDRKSDDVSRREQALGDREKHLDDLRSQLDEALKQRLVELERVANMTRQEAQGILLKELEQELRNEIARKVREAELAARDESEKRARAIVTEAIQRIAADQTAETSVSVLPLPSEDMKGRIIGREGRNIRALQQATGIDIIVDDTPEAVIISGFDPVRREVARVTLNKLIVDGRIHPARIEETVAKARLEVAQRVKEEGEAAVLDVGLQGLHPEVVRHLGILRFRTSYGQQVLNHSKEVAHLAAMMAAEIGADVRIAKLSGLLHDIGKAIDHEVEGSHAVIGADLLQRHGVPAAVVHAVTTVPASTFNTVGYQHGVTAPAKIAGTPIRQGGKPLVVYVGAEYCPYCAAERWAVVAALSRFGTFHDLGQTHSSSIDVYPNTATFSFHGASYSSPYVAFQGRETQSNVPQNGGYAPLDTLTPEQEALIGKYDAPPYVSAANAGSIPFIDFGSTAYEWFCEVISTRPVIMSRTGWFAPWWPKGILCVFAPSTIERI